MVRSKISIGLHPIIRPRAGDFCYSDAEFDFMCETSKLPRPTERMASSFGILDQEGNVDIARTRQLVELSRPLSVTFHRAFDMSADLFRSLEDVCSTGVDRLLTSGGEQTCLQGVSDISRLVSLARNRIKIMAGGGIGLDNAARIIERTGVTEIHVSLGSPVKSPMVYRNPRISLGKAHGREYHRMQVVEENVRNLRQAISVLIR